MAQTGTKARQQQQKAHEIKLHFQRQSPGNAIDGAARLHKPPMRQGKVRKYL